MYGITPEADKNDASPTATSSELLERVKARAANIISFSKDDEPMDMETIAAALNTSGTTEKIDDNTEDKKELVDNQSTQMTMFDVLSEKIENAKSNNQEITAVVDEETSKQKYQDEFEEEAWESISSVENKGSYENVFALLKALGVPYIDKRNVNGALWIIGGKELSDIAKWCESFGLNFVFKPDGARATDGKPGWWTK